MRFVHHVPQAYHLRLWQQGHCGCRECFDMMGCSCSLLTNLSINPRYLSLLYWSFSDRRKPYQYLITRPFLTHVWRLWRTFPRKLSPNPFALFSAHYRRKTSVQSRRNGGGGGWYRNNKTRMYLAKAVPHTITLDDSKIVIHPIIYLNTPTQLSACRYSKSYVYVIL